MYQVYRIRVYRVDLVYNSTIDRWFLYLSNIYFCAPPGELDHWPMTYKRAEGIAGLSELVLLAIHSLDSRTDLIRSRNDLRNSGGIRQEICPKMD